MVKNVIMMSFGGLLTGASPSICNFQILKNETEQVYVKKYVIFRILDVSSFMDGRDGGVYCAQCYANRFGHKGRSQSAIRDVVFPAQPGDSTCPGCRGKVQS